MRGITTNQQVENRENRATDQNLCTNLQVPKGNAIYEHPKGSTTREMPEVQPLVIDPRVRSISCPMCRWSLKARGSKKKVELIRKQSRWITSSRDTAEVPSGALQCLPCCGGTSSPLHELIMFSSAFPSGQIGPLLGSSDTLLQQTVQLS